MVFGKGDHYHNPLSTFQSKYLSSSPPIFSCLCLGIPYFQFCGALVLFILFFNPTFVKPLTYTALHHWPGPHSEAGEMTRRIQTSVISHCFLPLCMCLFHL